MVELDKDKEWRLEERLKIKTKSVKLKIRIKSEVILWNWGMGSVSVRVPDMLQPYELSRLSREKTLLIIDLRDGREFMRGKSGNIAKNSVETIIACCIPFFCVITDNQLFMVVNDLTEWFWKKKKFP